EEVGRSNVVVDHIASANLLDDLLQLGFVTAMISGLTNKQQHALMVFGKIRQQSDGVINCIEDRGAVVTRRKIVQVVGDRKFVARKSSDSAHASVELHNADF